ncbi:MAG TPA: DUF983 domain-containing protein [Caulobacteraceae bacterium]|nr:DUF983 domain-containing protein [Caulobacteraceae bacterium]
MTAMGPWSRRPYLRSLTRGFNGRCPHCGGGRLFYRYLKVSPRCLACGHDLDRYPSDDGPPYFTILLVGHLVIVPLLVIFAPLIWKAPAWVIVPAAVAPVLAVTLLALPRVKGAVLGVLYALDINRGDAHLHTADHPD